MPGLLKQGPSNPQSRLGLQKGACELDHDPTNTAVEFEIGVL
jgi:hypothetical protein